MPNELKAMDAARPTTVRSTCSYCGVGCGVKVTRDARGALSLDGDAEHPANRGMLCSKGRNLHHVVQGTSDRLLYPTMRVSRAHPMERASWDAALERIAQVFKALIKRFGPESVGFYVSGQLLTEEYYIANKLMKGFIGSNNIDTNSRLCMSSAVAGYTKALGDDAVPICYDDIEATECFFIAGANPAWCHPILFRRIEARKASHPETRVIVVDPRRTQTCSLADLHLQIDPGTDVVLYNAIAGELIRNGWIDRPYIDAHVDGYDALESVALATSLTEAATVCGVPAEDIALAARWLGKSDSFLTMWAMGLNQSVAGVDKNLALLNLSLITGKIGKPGSGPFSLTGQPNAMGGREVGGLATTLAAHLSLEEPSHRARVAQHWGAPSISERPGLTATEMFDALESGRMKALWIACTNPAVSLPNLERVQRAMKNARFLVVQDISMRSDTLDYADVALPAAGWLEKCGTMTNSERRVSYLPKLVDAPGEALPDTRIWIRFAEKMGWKHAFSYAGEEEIFDEHAQLTRDTPVDMSGLSHARLKSEGPIQWPCPDANHPGTPRLFGDGVFPTPDGRARVHGVRPRANADATSEAFPFVLTSGRVREQWHTMTRTGKVRRLAQHLAEPFVELHPDDAHALGIRENDVVSIENDRGAMRVPAMLSDSVKRGVAFVPMHWGKKLAGELSRANALTSGAVDPVSREPDFKYSAVRVRKLERAPRRVVVIGAGAAALAFVEALVTEETGDSISVLGREPEAFYNRILLPEYISGKRSWPELTNERASAHAGMDIAIKAGVDVVRIDRNEKTVLTADGACHAYDTLVLATGSAPQIPPATPLALPGLYTLRSRGDADRIRRAAQDAPGKRAIVVGGGLLGVEMADALNALGLHCALLHRSSTLMGGVLDPAAGDILCETLEARGIRVHLDDSVVRYVGNEKVQGVRTRSGRHLPCDLVVIATGVRAASALAQDAGLEVRRGVVVDSTLCTSDPNILAIGEVAEFENRVCGTSPAAREQARVAARILAGRTWLRYRGSTPFNVLKIRDLSMCTVGAPLRSGVGVEEIIASDRARSTHTRLTVEKGRLVGAILVGDTARFDEFRRLIDDQTELDDVRGTLLGGGAPARPPLKGRVVCSCHHVGEGNLRETIAAGYNTLDALCQSSAAGTGCGSCLPELREILDSHSPEPQEIHA